MEVVCGTRRMGALKMKSSEWWNDEVRMSASDKMRAYEVWMQRRNGETYEKSKAMKGRVKRTVREGKRRADMSWLNCLSEDFERNKKMFWKEMTRVRKGENIRLEKRE